MESACFQNSFPETIDLHHRSQVVVCPKYSMLHELHFANLAFWKDSSYRLLKFYFITQPVSKPFSRC